MTTDALLERLEGVKRAGKGWTARCPSHEDKKPSLAVTPAEHGGTVLHCHAGCPTEAVVDALGLSMSDLFAEPSRPRGDRELISEYVYTDEQGEPLFSVLRYFPKDFRQRKADGSWKLNGVRRVLYRLPEVRQAIEQGRVVFLTEGEKDVDRLRGLGFVATTNAGGADRWREEYTQQLAGARVVILPDNDEPGRKHARTVAAAIESVAQEVRVVELPGVPEKGDASDWLDAGGTAEDLKALVLAAPLAETLEDPNGDALPQAVPIGSLPPAEPVKWALRGCVLAGDLNILAGPGGGGKSSTVIEILGGIGVGSPPFEWAEFEPAHPEGRPVLLISNEDPDVVIQNRAAALATGHGWDWEKLKQNFHVIALQGASLDRQEWRQHILAEVERIGAAAVAFDPYAELTTAKENSNDETKPNIQFFRQVARLPSTPAVIVVHHSGKESPDKRKQDRAIRGASALRDAARSVYFIEEKELGIGIECLKFNRGPKPAAFIVSREIKTDPENPAVWISARLSYLSERQAEEDESEQFIRQQLERYGQANTTELKELAKGTGISAVQLSKAISRMETLKEIAFEPGKNNSKNWYLKTVAEKNPAIPASEVASLPNGCPATENSPPAVAPTYREGNRAGAGGNGQADYARSLEDS